MSVKFEVSGDKAVWSYEASSQLLHSWRELLERGQAEQTSNSLRLNALLEGFRDRPIGLTSFFAGLDHFKNKTNPRSSLSSAWNFVNRRYFPGQEPIRLFRETFFCCHFPNDVQCTIEQGYENDINRVFYGIGPITDNMLNANSIFLEKLRQRLQEISDGYGRRIPIRYQSIVDALQYPVFPLSILQRSWRTKDPRKSASDAMSAISKEIISEKGIVVGRVNISGLYPNFIQ